MEYKQKLIELLKWKRDPGDTATKFQQQFDKVCIKVEVLVLDPMPKELQQIFYKNGNKTNVSSEPGAKRDIISFENIIKIFPNLHSVFLRNTTFNLRICYQFVSFIQNYHQTDETDETGDSKLKLERLFFRTKDKRMLERDEVPVKAQLNKINWDFLEFEQTVFKKDV